MSEDLFQVCAWERTVELLEDGAEENKRASNPNKIFGQARPDLCSLSFCAKSIHSCHGMSISYNQPSVFSQQQNKFDWEKSLLIKTSILGTNIIVMS